MTILVDLRRWRIEADPVRLDQPAGHGAPPPSPAPAMPDAAEIIVFPRIRKALLQRPRKSLKRRFGRHALADAVQL